MLIHQYLHDSLANHGYIFQYTEILSEKALGKFKLVNKQYPNRKLFFDSYLAISQYLHELDNKEIPTESVIG